MAVAYTVPRACGSLWCVGLASPRQSGNALTTGQDCERRPQGVHHVGRSRPGASSSTRRPLRLTVLGLPLKGTGAERPRVCADFAWLCPASGCQSLRPHNPRDGRYVASKGEAALRPARKPASRRFFSRACSPLHRPCRGGAVTAVPDQTLPATEPANGSGHFGDGAMSGNLGSLEPNVAAGMEGNLQARGEDQPSAL